MIKVYLNSNTEIRRNPSTAKAGEGFLLAFHPPFGAMNLRGFT